MAPLQRRHDGTKKLGGHMETRKVTVKNKSGLHARPANNFVKAATKYKNCNVYIVKDGNEINAKSILNVLGACITTGTEIEILTVGENEKACADDLASLVESGLGE